MHKESSISGDKKDSKYVRNRREKNESNYKPTFIGYVYRHLAHHRTHIRFSIYHE